MWPVPNTSSESCVFSLNLMNNNNLLLPLCATAASFAPICFAIKAKENDMLPLEKNRVRLDDDDDSDEGKVCFSSFYSTCIDPTWFGGKRISTFCFVFCSCWRSRGWKLWWAELTRLTGRLLPPVHQKRRDPPSVWRSWRQNKVTLWNIKIY